MGVKQDWIKITYHKNYKGISGTLNTLEFLDHGSFTIFVPSLNLSSYGDTIVEAKEMMTKVVIPDFCETILEQSVEKAINDLKDLGWSQSPFFKKELSRTAYINKKGLIKELNISENTEVNERVLTV